MVIDFHIFRIAEIFYRQRTASHLADAFVGQRDLLFLFLDGKIRIHSCSVSDKAIRRSYTYLWIHHALSGNDQRRSRFIDQDGVHLIDDGVIQAPSASCRSLIKHHVVPQIVKTEFVICTVSNIRVIGGLSLFFTDTVDHAAYRQAQEAIELSHPLRITLCQIVVDCYNMDALAFQRVQIYRQASPPASYLHRFSSRRYVPGGVQYHR